MTNPTKRYTEAVEAALKHRDDGPGYWGLTRPETPLAAINLAVLEYLEGLLGEMENFTLYPSGPVGAEIALFARDGLRRQTLDTARKELT